MTTLRPDPRARAAPAAGAGPWSPALQLKNVGKSFGSVIALRDISLHVDPGTVTCVLGDNGAGKSTLIKILSGVHQPTEGEFLVNGEPTTFSSPRDALGAGIATVFQDLATVPLMSVWRNFFLGNEPQRGSGRSSSSTRARPSGSAARSCSRWASTSATWSSRSARCPAASARPSRSPGPSTSAPRC